MTATATRPLPARAAPDAVDARDGLDVVATLALALYSFVAALGFARVFADWQFVPDVAVIVIIGHGTSLLMRRLRVPPLISITVTALALAWVVAWVAYPTTFSAIFPTRDTWDIGWADLGLVRDQFPRTVAPVEYVGGWSLLAAIGTAFAVFTGDTFAFHARARGEALVPGAVLFVFVAALGEDNHRVGLTLALIVAGFLAVAVLRVRFAQPPRTSLGRPRHPLSVVLPAAVVAAATVALGAWIVGPRLPGASDDPLFETHHNQGGVTEVLSPLVDIRTRLVNRADTALFDVQATAPAYWRVSGLPEFDGTTWGLPDRSLEDVDGQLSAPAPGAAANRQDFTVSGLRGKLVPAAAEPQRATPSAGLRWNAETSTLVRVDRDLSPGDRFSIVSTMPTFTPEVLRAATTASPPDPIYLDLPGDFPRSITETALSVTDGQPTTYDRMLALQNWFRSTFQYSVDVAQGHSTSAIEAFLRQRIGYCEQFAGTFAAMARALGVPARVAVGYTPGIAQADGSRQVLGKNAHAWPEVWFDGPGWVPFEPTPGRGEPGTQDYTGVAPAQDETPAGAGTGTGAGADALPTPPLVTIAPPSNPITDPDVTSPEKGLDPAAFTTTVPDHGPAWGTIGIVVGLILLALALPAIVRWWRRTHPSSDVARQMATLWRRALGAVEATGCRVDPSLTPIEQARAISPRLPVASRPLKSLAEMATAATYGTNEVVAHLIAANDAGGVTLPRRWCRQVERIAADSMTTGGRLRRYFTVWA